MATLSAALVAVAAMAACGTGAHAASSTTLLVSDAGANDVLQFDTSGNLLGTFIAAGSGGLVTPLALTTDASGDVYVLSDDFNSATGFDNSILEYSSNGAFLKTVVSDSGSASSGLFEPYALTMTASGALLTGSTNNAGALLTYNRTTGANTGTLAQSGVYPFSLAYGATGNLYVGLYNSVEEINGTTGALVSAFSAPDPSGTLSTNPYGADAATGLAFGPNGSLYADYFASSTIVEYNPTTGAQITAFNPTGGSLTNPNQIAFDASGDLLVANGDGSIEEYNATTGFFAGDLVSAASGDLATPYGLTYLTVTSNTAAAPEPSSAALALLAALPLAGAWVRARKAAR